MIFLLLSAPCVAQTTRTTDFAPWWFTVEQMERSLKDDKAILTRRYAVGVTALHIASARGDVVMVRAMLDHGLDPNTRDELGTTPLIYAARGLASSYRAGRYAKFYGRDASAPPRRYLETIDLLLKRGGDAGAWDRDGVTPLSVAASAPSLFAVEHLLRAGADPNAVYHRGNESVSVIEEAVQSGSADVVRILIAHRAKVMMPDKRRRILFAQFAAGNPDVLRQLLKAGADFSHRPDGRGPGDMALNAAAMNARYGSVALLADHLSSQRADALLIATIGGGPDFDPRVRLRRLRTVAWLLSNGASPNAPRGIAFCVIGAAMKGHVEIALLLKLCGAHLDPSKLPPDKDGNNDVMLAAVNRPWRAYLLRAFGYPLGIHSASAYGFLNDVKRILDQDPQQVNGWPSASPLMLAARGGHLEIVKLLISRGANVNPTVERGGWIGATPLEAAAADGHVEVMEFLIRHGADVNVTDADGNTLLERLESDPHHHPRAISTLRRHGALTTKPAR